jgi:hypothetical protein
MSASGDSGPGNSVRERGAAAHRQRLLGRIRVISLGVAASAVVASLGLGMALAHAIPGHARPAGAAAAAGSAAVPGHRRQAAPPRSSRPVASRHEHAHRRRLAPAPRPPASTPAPPQVSSGGS